jgi:nucleoside-diphosphate-sugar epimerase
VAVYGTKSIPADENIIPEPDNPYGKSKLAAERLIKKWVAAESRRKAFVVRPAVVIGPRNLANMFFLIDQIYKKRYLFNFGTGENIKSIAHVKNLTDFTLFLLRNELTGDERFNIFNYVDYPQLSIRENIKIIHEELGIVLPKVTIPLSLAVLIGTMFDIVIKVTGKNLPISSARLKKIATSTHFEAKNIKKVNFIPGRSIESGIREMVRWYLNDYRKYQ